MNVPNAISMARIAACPVITWLALAPGTVHRYAAFILFVLAALSDVWDGHLARKHGWITDTGKLLDPVADKLLLASTFIPFYFITRRPDALDAMPWWGTMPVWVLVVILGRELFITLFRGYAARRGVVIAAGKSGKYKALIQNFFIGGLLFWYAITSTAAARDWSSGVWNAWRHFNSAWIGIMLAVAIGLTVFSMGDYLWRYRTLVRDHA
ncbi:MAG: hypothetical protein F4139_07885 [Gemmatimonadetes bacterium]|nr:hypothetical protein [Gemmatimonadota bacterium]MYA64149.1 hypothetical protein [Gemmatimonadota bacterium]MYB98769.1 hypothetical protein [Gemmatimonadota bacterium]MYH52855.1 hypothetical protein [Gemmatimonadota bacterium]MYI46199.1 hypothetical protein [Gemmatimonadota bacterium]